MRMKNSFQGGRAHERILTFVHRGMINHSNKALSFWLNSFERSIIAGISDLLSRKKARASLGGIVNPMLFEAKVSSLTSKQVNYLNPWKHHQRNVSSSVRRNQNPRLLLPLVPYI